MPLNDAQLEQLFKPINPTRISKRDGMSYLETWDVEAHLTRIFGFGGWDKVIDYGVVYEYQRTKPDGKPGGWDVCYHAKCQLTVRDPEGGFVTCKEDVATGMAQNQPQRGAAHDLALKSASSDSLKRAAKDLGNQFGLSLYCDGTTESVVGSSLAYPKKEGE